MQVSSGELRAKFGRVRSILTVDCDRDGALNVLNDFFRRCQKQKHLYKIGPARSVNLFRQILKKAAIVMISDLV